MTKELRLKIGALEKSLLERLKEKALDLSKCEESLAKNPVDNVLDTDPPGEVDASEH